MDYYDVRLERVEDHHGRCPACQELFAAPAMFVYRPLNDSWQAICRDCTIFMMRTALVRCKQGSLFDKS